jgi:hypothetical protein
MKLSNTTLICFSFLIPYAATLFIYQELIIYFKEKKHKRTCKRLSLDSNYEKQKLKDKIDKTLASLENDPMILNDLSINLLIGLKGDLSSELSLTRLKLIYERIREIKSRNASLRMTEFDRFERIDLSRYYFEIEKAVKELFKLRILFNEKVFTKVQQRNIFLLNFKKSRSKFTGHRTKIIIDEDNSALNYVLV